MNDVGKKIKERRLELGWSQDELAKKVGYASRSSINKLENTRDMPIKKLKPIADALGVDIKELMGWQEEEAPRYSKPDEKIIADFIFDRTKNKYIRQLYDTLGDITDEEGKELIMYAEFIKSKRQRKDPIEYNVIKNGESVLMVEYPNGRNNK